MTKILRPVGVTIFLVTAYKLLEVSIRQESDNITWLQKILTSKLGIEVGPFERRRCLFYSVKSVQHLIIFDLHTVRVAIYIFKTGRLLTINLP